MNLDKALSDIFDNGAEAPLELEAERVAIAKAKLGDSAATVELLYAYAPALRNSVAQYRYAGGVWADGPRDGHRDDELRMAAVEGLVEAINAFDGDKHNRLAAVIRQYVQNSPSEALISGGALTVPPRTLRRFYYILREAEGNVYDAATLAPAYEMTKETFFDVLSAVRTVDLRLPDSDSDDFARDDWANASPVWDGRYPDVEDRILVESAFRAVDTLEKDVVSMSYGFTEYDPIPDGVIADRLLLSRQKTQRVRTGALDKMRSALGVA